MVDPSKFNPLALNETKAFREYMAKEAFIQYKDYYETDSEEQRFFEFMD